MGRPFSRCRSASPDTFSDTAVTEPESKPVEQQAAPTEKPIEPLDPSALVTSPNIYWSFRSVDSFRSITSSRTESGRDSFKSARDDARSLRSFKSVRGSIRSNSEGDETDHPAVHLKPCLKRSTSSTSYVSVYSARTAPIGSTSQEMNDKYYTRK